MNILFVFAHPDDEAYGPYGTMVELVKQGHTVKAVCMCNGERPGFEHVSSGRIAAFKENCEVLNIPYNIYNSPDLSLTSTDTMKTVEAVVHHFKPEIIYTNNISDINWDHRTVAEACLIASRPKPDNSINELYFFEIPSSTEWTFGQVSPEFKANTYVEISEESLELKKAALSRYSTEIYNFPDARSVEAIETLAKYRGFLSGVNYAEAFQLVFARCRKTP